MTRSITLVATFILYCTLNQSAQAMSKSENSSLIRQVEQLIETISPTDRIQLRALTVKLANLHYAEALRISAEEDITDTANARALEKHQKLAASFFEKFVFGDKGKFDPPFGEQLASARLQLSHMYGDLGRIDDAKKIWADLVKQDEFPAIMSEAALSLAEVSEAEDAASDDALKLYALVSKTNKKHDTIQYANYRSAWIYRNQGDFDTAITTLRKCLYDSTGVVKEEVVNDIIVFYSLSTLDHMKAYTEIKSYSDKLQRPDFLKLLADAYIAAGNKGASVAVLKKVTSSDPNSVHSIRLLEESYGLRDWDTFESTLDKLSGLSSKGADEKILKEFHTVLKRLAIQLDAERVTTAELTPKFTSVVDIFAGLFPKDEIVEKMVVGAVMAESDGKAKIKRINGILANATLAISVAQKLVLREQLVHLYQEAGNHVEAAAVSGYLAVNATDAKDKRRFKFVQASEYYDQEKEEPALKLFRELIAENSVDDIGRKSQLLATRYLGRTKKYSDALAMTAPWLERAKGDKDAAGSNEFKEIAEMHEKIVFENAVDQGAELKSLMTFLSYCRDGKFVPNSCTNAESLAVKLKRYDDLLVLLQEQKRSDDILSILESSGRFESLAKELEKDLAVSSELPKILRVALFWEINGSLDERNRILATLVKAAAKNGFASDAEENLVFATLYDADLINKHSLAIKWNESNRCYITNEVVTAGETNKSIRESLLACKTSPGKAWEDIVYSTVQSLDEKSRKISFYGNGSKKKFERRIAAINEMLKEIDTYLPATNHEGYVKLGGMAAAVLNDFAIEIETTPLPEEATEEMIPEITTALSEMAIPFREKANAYQDLVDSENKKFAETSPVAKKALAEKPKTIAITEIQRFLKTMHNDPDNAAALTGLYGLFDKNGHRRPAAYIQGRLSVLKPAGEKPATH